MSAQTQGVVVGRSASAQGAESASKMQACSEDHGTEDSECGWNRNLSYKRKLLVRIHGNTRTKLCHGKAQSDGRRVGKGSAQASSAGRKSQEGGSGLTSYGPRAQRLGVCQVIHRSDPGGCLAVCGESWSWTRREGREGAGSQGNPGCDSPVKVVGGVRQVGSLRRNSDRGRQWNKAVQ